MIPVVLVHGFMGGSPQWEAQRDMLGDIDIIAVDLPGFGANAHLEALQTIEANADWVLNDLAVRQVKSFHLLGHSMGGMIAQEMVAKAPERIARLVLYGTGAQGVLPGRFETNQTSKERARTEGARATARRIAATWFLAREDDAAYETCASIAEQSSPQAIFAGLDAMNNWSGIDNLPTLSARTLVIWGDNDRTYPWSQTDQLWRSISGASLAVVPFCAHVPHLEKTHLFNSILRDFLNS